MVFHFVIRSDEVNVTFRKMKKKDIPAVISLCNECFNEETSLTYALKTYKNHRKDPRNTYLVGMVDGKIVSHLKITIVPTIYERMNTYAILNHVCVKEEFRRHNVATRMLDEAVKIALDMGCKKVELWSNNVRTAAHACYYKYGFTLDDAGFFEKQIRE